MCKPKKDALVCAKGRMCKMMQREIFLPWDESPRILLCVVQRWKKSFHDIIIEQFKCNASHLTLYDGKRKNVITMHTWQGELCRSFSKYALISKPFTVIVIGLICMEYEIVIKSGFEKLTIWRIMLVTF